MTPGLTIINGRPLRYRIRRHPRARRRLVRVSRDTGVVVTLPRGDRLEIAQELLQDWADWVEERVDREGVWNGPVVRSFASGSKILVYGRPRTLALEISPPGRRSSRMILQEDSLRLELPAPEVLDPRAALLRHLKKEAGVFLRGRVRVWSEKTGLYPRKVVVGERRTRWGSCSARRTLSFCYRLVMAPVEVADAIVVHELCHLKHLDHSDRFYALLESFLPDYHETVKWLQENGAQMKL